MQEVKVILRKGKDQAVRRKHPWIFSGAISIIESEINEGDLVAVYSSSNEFLAKGHWQNSSIAIRCISFENEQVDDNFWFKKLESAFFLRKILGLTNSDNTNVYRLVHAEGDGLPGLIIDFYNNNLVIQAHSIGMHLNRFNVKSALLKLYGDQLDSIYYKSADSLPACVEESEKHGFLHGSTEECMVNENGSNFRINWITGQKTGFFIDQRESRKLLADYSQGKSILNTFCYTGGFSIAALKKNAAAVTSVDSSKIAIALTEMNVELNGFEGKKHISCAMDTITFLNSTNQLFDIIVLDPPAYAKHIGARHNAVQGYKRLNAIAMKKLAPNGLLFTFSCSQVVDRRLFEDTVFAAAIESGREAKVLHHLSQPADHPVSIFHPEGEYLKGLVLFVK